MVPMTAAAALGLSALKGLMPRAQQAAVMGVNQAAEAAISKIVNMTKSTVNSGSSNLRAPVVRARGGASELLVQNRPPPRRKPKRNKRGRRVRRGNAGTNSAGQRSSTVGLQQREAPRSLGTIIPQNRFTFGGRPQMIADYDTDRGLRVQGSSLFAVNIAGNMSDQGGFAVAARIAPFISTFYFPLIPQNIDVRLATIAEVFQFYAFRKLRINYIPVVGTQTTNNVALGITQDLTFPAQYTTPTQQQLLNLSDSLTTPVWNAANLDFTHVGSKLWNTNQNNLLGDGIGAPDVLQAILCSSLFTSSATTFVYYGTLWIDYVCDLYEPQAPIPFPTRVREVATSEEKEDDDDSIVVRTLPQRGPNGKKV